MILEGEIQSKLQKVEDGWQCIICDHVGNHKGNMLKHVESRHLPQYYSCEICSLVCKGLNSYNVHYSRKHKK